VNAHAVVVRWRGGDEVDRCLRSLLDNGGPHLTGIVLVDSGSGDGGAERLAVEFPEVEVVALESNHSFAHAANTGVGPVSEDLVLLLNPDTEIEDGAVNRMIEALAELPDAAGAVPTLTDTDGSSQHRWQFRELPSAVRLATGRPGAPEFSATPTAVTAVTQPAAAAWMIRTRVWRALGGFDEVFRPAWWEDVDFCARLASRLGDEDFPADGGFFVVPQARVRHVGGSSVAFLGDEAFLEAYNRNLLRYAERHHPDRLGLIRVGLRWSLRVRVLLHPTRRRAYLHAVGRILA
jgi:GT2 family glycosyltransferase